MVKWNGQTTKTTPKERLHMLYKYYKAGRLDMVLKHASQGDLNALKRYYGIDVESQMSDV